MAKTIKEARIVLVYDDDSEELVGATPWQPENLANSSGKPLQISSGGFTISKQMKDGLLKVSLNGFIR